MRVKSLTPPFPSVFPMTPMTSSALYSPPVMPFSSPEASDTDFNSTLRTSIAIVFASRLRASEPFEMCGRSRLARQVAAIGLADDLAVARDDLAGLDRRDRPALERLAFEWREVRHALQVFRAHHLFHLEVDDDEVSIGADRDRALLRVDAIDAGRRAGRALDQDFKRHAAQAAIVQQCGQVGAERRQTRPRAMEAGFRFVGRARP